MIGARREWLDPIEMAIYNADLMKVLAATGTFRVLHTALDTCLTAIKEGKECELPKIVMTAEKATINELSLIHISEPTRRTPISYAVFCLKKKKQTHQKKKKK